MSTILDRFDLSGMPVLQKIAELRRAVVEEKIKQYRRAANGDSTDAFLIKLLGNNISDADLAESMLQSIDTVVHAILVYLELRDGNHPEGKI